MNKLLLNIRIAYFITLSCVSMFVLSSCEESFEIETDFSNESFGSRAYEETTTEEYYYYHNEKLPILLDTTKVYVVIRDNSEEDLNVVSPLKVSASNEDNYTGFIMN